jgi:hypothetical protein
MATVTPNFNWPVPTSTDLVKDGATAIEALGDSIDGSLVDLKGGTTGQVLSKTSGTDMDFTWVTTDDANAIQNSIVDAKGDLISATANDTPARLAVGNNGETLVADSSTSTGLRYTAGTPISNPIINSAMQVWQRTTSLAATTSLGNYSADRWMCRVSSTVTNTFSRQLTSDTTNLPNIQYCMRIQRTAGQTATPLLILEYSQETVNSIPYAGKTVTMSFYARAGANFSASGNAFTARLKTGTGTDQNIANTYTGEATTIDASATLTTTWQRFSYTGTVAATATEMGLQCFYTATGTAGAADYMEVTGFQIDIGSVALPFRTYAATLQGELAACQRYYYLAASGSAKAICMATYYASNEVDGVINFPVSMRTAPTLSQVTGTDYYIAYRNSGNDTFNSFTLAYATNTAANIYNGTEASGTAGHGAFINTNNASSFLAFQAEL